MRNFFKWILAVILFSIGYSSLILFNECDNQYLSIVLFVLYIIFLTTPALNYWKEYIDKVFDNK